MLFRAGLWGVCIGISHIMVLVGDASSVRVGFCKYVTSDLQILGCVTVNSQIQRGRPRNLLFWMDSFITPGNVYSVNTDLNFQVSLHSHCNVEMSMHILLAFSVRGDMHFYLLLKVISTLLLYTAFSGLGFSRYSFLVLVHECTLKTQNSCLQQCGQLLQCTLVLYSDSVTFPIYSV